MSSPHEEPAESKSRCEFPDLITLGQYRGEVGAYVRDWLGPVLDFDTERGTRLAATLRAYLDAWGDHRQTARTLGIHTSTARYRIHRIRSLLGDDLTDSNTRFNLQVATRLLDESDGHGQPQR